MGSLGESNFCLCFEENQLWSSGKESVLARCSAELNRLLRDLVALFRHIAMQHDWMCLLDWSSLGSVCSSLGGRAFVTFKVTGFNLNHSAQLNLTLLTRKLFVLKEYTSELCTEYCQEPVDTLLCPSLLISCHLYHFCS